MKRTLTLTVALLALVVVAACGTPAAAPVATQVPAPEATEAPAEPTAVPGPTEMPAEPAAEAAPASAESPITFVIVPEASEARYRVTEQLAGRDLPNDAVGVTKSVSGQIVVQPDGTLVPGASSFEVDVTGLKTDQARRDGYVSRNVLQTSQYPKVTFVPTGAGGLPSPLPGSGEGSFELSGDLTVRGVTRPVTWQITLKRDGDTLTGQALTSFTFADFQMEQPRVPVVLSVADEIGLELDFTMKQAQPSTSQ